MTSRTTPRSALLRLMLGACAVVPAGCAPEAAPPADEKAAAAVLAFDRSVLLEQEGATSANVSIGDLDADGHLDIVLVKGRHWPLIDMLLMGDGTGSFQPARHLSEIADRSYSGDLVDIDADGDLDIVISNDNPDPKIVYRNDGHGGFTPASSFGKGAWSTRHINVADVNGDGQPDIIVANRTGDSSGANYVCINHGGGQFDEECSSFSHESATTVSPADFDGDGTIDLAVPHREGGQSHIYRNDGSGGFGEGVPFGPADAAIRQAEAADLNGDGLLDIVVIDERTGPAILYGAAPLEFGAPEPLGERGPTPYSLALADLNDDGRMDILVGYVESHPVAFFNDGAGGFTAVPFGDDLGVAYGFATGDIDEDGTIDIAVARSDAPNVLYFGR